MRTLLAIILIGAGVFCYLIGTGQAHEIKGVPHPHPHAEVPQVDLKTWLPIPDNADPETVMHVSEAFAEPCLTGKMAGTQLSEGDVQRSCEIYEKTNNWLLQKGYAS